MRLEDKLLFLWNMSAPSDPKPSEIFCLLHGEVNREIS